MSQSLNSNNHGYIAITTSIILTIVVTLLALSFNLSSSSNHITASALRNKNLSLSLANGCAEHALLQLKASSSYAGNEMISVNSRTCTIFPLETPDSNTKIIKTSDSSSGYTGNIKIQLDLGGFSIVSWQELTSF